MEQPLLRRSDEIYARVRLMVSSLDASELICLCDRILSASRVFLLGAGQTGLVLRMLAMRLTQMGLHAFLPGECTTPAIAPGDLLLAASRSGGRPGVLALAQEARRAGAEIALFTASPESSLAQLANQVVVVKGETANSDEQASECGGPLLLGTGFELMLQFAGVLLVEELMRRRGLGESALHARHANLE